MKLTHIVVASAALVSFGAIAAGAAKNDRQSQGGQTESQSASGGATQQQSERSGGQQQASQDKELVKQAQEKLSAAGHDVGQADGILGPKTQKGLKDFQQSKGLQASGQLDQKTLSALGVSGGDTSASTGSTSGKPAGSSSGSEKSK